MIVYSHPFQVAVHGAKTRHDSQHDDFTAFNINNKNCHSNTVKTH